MLLLLYALGFFDGFGDVAAPTPVRFNPTMGPPVSFAPTIGAPVRFYPTFTP